MLLQGNSAPNAVTTGSANAVTRDRGNGRGRGRGRRPFVRQTSESDPYDMSISPLNIYENQAIPVGLHNLSKSFRPNLSTIQVYCEKQNVFLNGNSKKEIT